MSPELIAIIVMGLTLAGLIFTLSTRQERRMERRMEQLEERMNRRMDRLEERMNQRMDRLEEQTAQRFDAMDARLRGLEQGQAHLAGEMSTLREAILLRAAIQG